MKTSKTLTVAALMAAASASMVQAATYDLYVTGSTAFRASTYNAIANILTSPKASFNGGATIDKSNQVTFTGTIGSDTWNIYASFSGSEAGIKTVSQITTPLPTITFLTTGNTQSSVSQPTSPAVLTGGTAVSGTPMTEQDTPTVAMSDVFQASSPFHGTVSGITYATLLGATVTGLPTSTVVGVVPFKFISSKTLSNGTAEIHFNLMTTQLARKVFTSTGGVAKLSQFTGSNADSGIAVYAVGRNHDSGTRTGAVLETGIDKAGTSTTAIQQYYPLDINGNIIGTTGAGTTIEDLELVPAETVNGISYAAGKSGYSSGGSLAKVFTATNDLANTVFVTYLGLSDANSALAGNAQEMSYNGITYSTTNLQQGRYTFWTYEHLYYNNSLGSHQKTTANSIATQIATADASTSGVLINSSFKATRVPVTTDGAIVSQ